MNKLKKYGVLLLSCLTLATAPATVLPSNTLIAEHTLEGPMQTAVIMTTKIRVASEVTTITAADTRLTFTQTVYALTRPTPSHPVPLQLRNPLPQIQEPLSLTTCDFLLKVFDATITIRHIRISRPRSGAIPSTSSHIFTLPECPKAGKDAQILMSTCTKKTIPISRQRLEAI